MEFHMARSVGVGSVLLLAIAQGASAGVLRGQVAGATVESPAVVWVEGLPAAPPVGHDTVITHRKGRLDPPVAIGFVGNAFVLRNDDDVLHTTHLSLRLAYQKAASERPLESGATLFNVALPKKGVEIRKPIEAYQRYRDDTGFIEVRCNPHPSERAYVLVFDHPYATLTGEGGAFSIPDVPAGTHEVRVWHAGHVSTGRPVVVGDGAPTELRLEVD